MNTIKPYKKDLDISFTSGAYVTFELLDSRPERLKMVFIHSSFTDPAGLSDKCGSYGVPIVSDDRIFSRMNQKGNSYVLGVFQKYSCTLDPAKAHILLVNPSDMGNLGTIIRTAAGLGFNDLAIISPAADIFDPKTIRASMGSLFRLNFMIFENFSEYRSAYPDHICYPFMLDGYDLPEILSHAHNPLFTLIFGNEAKGLGSEFSATGKAVKIPQSPLVDSLNLSVAVGIGAYLFAAKYGLILSANKNL